MRCAACLTKVRGTSVVAAGSTNLPCANDAITPAACHISGAIMKSVEVDKANAVCGALFVALGLFFGTQSLDLDLGTAFRMGPGYFPFLLACALVLLGGIILFHSFRSQNEGIGPIAWRGLLFILPSAIFFGLTIRGLGFVPSLFLTAFIASFASSRMTPVLALLLSAGLTLFSVLVFQYGLGLPFRTFGPWLGF